MAMIIRLLGTPSIEVDGVPMGPLRGRKSWALLAYLVLAERPASRRRLAELLFPDADDPLGALRWSLAELRRGLGTHAVLAGDPVCLQMTSCVVDVDFLRGDSTQAAAWEPAGDLLEGMSFAGCDTFETWLLVERRRLAAAGDALLHERALALLGHDRADVAVGLAAMLVGRSPLDENYQALLIRCLATSGDVRAATEQVARCEDLFQRELGCLPSPALRGAVEASGRLVALSPQVGRAAARAQLEAGTAAISAGAVDAGLECLRRAITEASACRDASLEATALVELGGALVHAVRGRDEEGAAVLHQGMGRAREVGDRRLAAKACRELGFIDVQAGRRERADSWLSEAAALAVDDDGELAAICGVRAMNLSDTAYYREADEQVTRSIEHALREGNRRQHVWSLSMRGRMNLLRGQPACAAEVLDECLAIVQSERWAAFLPWPESLRAETSLIMGDVEDAGERYAHAWALACQLADPCWEGIAARGMGLLEARRGSIRAALTWLADALNRCTRWPDAYSWVHAYVLDAICTTGFSVEDPQIPSWVDELAELASRSGMREMVVRAHLHMGKLGSPGALEAAELAVQSIDNPSLASLVSEARGAHR